MKIQIQIDSIIFESKPIKRKSQNNVQTKP